MPCCCAINCSKRTENGIRLFLLPQGPKNALRRKEWIRNINRKDYLPDKAYVCEKHFTFDQFENNRADGKRLLRWNAVPTIFSHEEPIKSRKPRKVRLVLEKKEPDIQDQEANFIQELEVSYKLEENDACEEPSGIINQTTEHNQTAEELSLLVEELKRKLINEQKKTRKLNQEMIVLKNHIESVFNEDQIDYLKKGRMMGREWQVETIEKSWQLYLSCGTTGYEELRKQNYPLPSIRTLQRRMETHKLSSGTLTDVFPMLKVELEYDD